MVNPIRRQPLKMIAVRFRGHWQLWEGYDLESATKRILSTPVLEGIGAGLPDEITEVIIGERFAITMGPINLSRIEPHDD